MSCEAPQRQTPEGRSRPVGASDPAFSSISRPSPHPSLLDPVPPPSPQTPAIRHTLRAAPFPPSPSPPPSPSSHPLLLSTAVPPPHHDHGQQPRHPGHRARWQHPPPALCRPHRSRGPRAYQHGPTDRPDPGRGILFPPHLPQPPPDDDDLLSYGTNDWEQGSTDKAPNTPVSTA